MSNQIYTAICDCCFSEYSVGSEICPYCGYQGILRYKSQIPKAMEIGSIIGDYKLGMAIEEKKDAISYLAWHTKKRQRYLLKEFFVGNCMMRETNGVVKLRADADGEQVEQAATRFQECCSGEGWIENGTLYSAELYSGRIHLPRENTEYAVTVSTWIGKRENQEDIADFRNSGNYVYAVLCDGMGGLNGGEIASESCLMKLMEVSDAIEHCEEEMIPVILRGQIAMADGFISCTEDEGGRPLHGGTTLLCVAIRGDYLYYASVGDSRIYLLHDSRLDQLTVEHNLLTDLLKQVDAGEISRGEALSHPKREALTSYVGIGNVNLIDLSGNPVLLSSCDTVMLCSDGLYRALSDDEIIDCIDRSETVNSAAEALMKAVQAKDLPHQDNTTIILIQKK